MLVFTRHFTAGFLVELVLVIKVHVQVCFLIGQDILGCVAGFSVVIFDKVPRIHAAYVVDEVFSDAVVEIVVFVKVAFEFIITVHSFVS